MRYQDFDPGQKEAAEELIVGIERIWMDDGYDDQIDVNALEDDEIFFRGEDDVKQVIDSYIDRFGPYGDMARGLYEYMSSDPEIGEVKDLGWGYVMLWDDDVYVFYSNSWSDSGLFLNA